MTTKKRLQLITGEDSIKDVAPEDEVIKEGRGERDVERSQQRGY